MSLCINPGCADPQNSDDHLFCKSCGSELLLEGRYRVLGMRGQGGLGRTYEVSDLGSSPKILKILTDNHPKHVELFQREVNLLSQLDHPGIPRIEPNSYFMFYPGNSKEPLHCFVMEKIVGLDLQEYLNQRGFPIDERLAIQWLKQVLKILHVIHGRQVLHRDIKPSNIMLKANGHICLVGFGSACIVGTTLNQPIGTRVFSSFYTPREQIQDQAVPQSDFFALGRSFIYLIIGKELSEFFDEGVGECNWNKSTQKVSTQFATILEWLIKPLASHRPANAEVVLKQISILESSGRFNLNTHLKKVSEAQSSTVKETSSAESPPTNQYSSIERINPPTSSLNQPILRQPPQTYEPTEESKSIAEPNVAKPISKIRPEFGKKCQQVLAEYIGPISSIVYQHVLAQNPDVSEEELVELLVIKIPNPAQTEEFRRRLFS
ncbi:serine/threonine-protein kinase [Acaryochloris marina]|uniref:Serine/threonine protein kinase n=1 Tax=Acaryochloris marina (strain MBIC 11017) TaxID=329726 RepID=A8ZQ69_ACAM1|nr:serine/threonine-protein kinase [Acaryochloris marina]ABW33096.1 serine/threonine protein kinase [Acaryochloris marina MBIC11017]